MHALAYFGSSLSSPCGHFIKMLKKKKTKTKMMGIITEQLTVEKQSDKMLHPYCTYKTSPSYFVEAGGTSLTCLL